MMKMEVPITESTTNFISLGEDDRIRAIELGTILLSKGADAMQMWNSEEWEQKINAMEYSHKTIVKNIRQDTSNVIAANAELKQELSAAANKRDDAIRVGIESNRIQYESIIAQLNSNIDSMRIHTTEREDTIRKTVARELESIYGSQLSDLRIRSDRRIDELTNDVASSRDKYEQLLVSTNSRAQNSSVKGQDGEDFVFANLNRMFPSAEVEDTHKISERGDFIVKDKDFCMMIENKNYARNVTKSEIEKFYRDVDNPVNADIQCAILVSMTSGVSCKSDFEFEMRNGKPVLFLHNAETAIDNIKIGANFFRMILEQSHIDFTDKEVIVKLKHISGLILKDRKKMRTTLDKYYTSQMKLYDDSDSLLKDLFVLVGI